jgi:hypothetical protein
MNENDNNDRNWQIDVNLSGLQAPTGNANVPQGYYKARVADMYIKPEKPGRIVVRLSITEGAFAGSVRHTGLTIPRSAEDKVRYYWRGFAESCGYGPEALDKGELSLGRDSFMDKVAHVFYTPKEQSSDGYDKVDFLPPVEWTQRSASFVPSEAAPAADAGSALGATNLGGTSGGTTSAADVKAKLGL